MAKYDIPDTSDENDCEFKASPVDRCMLYVFRCAIYYASNTDHDPGLPSEALAKVGAVKMGELEG